MAQESRYNVLLVTTDEQRYDAMGCNGNPHIRTPHLDALAKQSVNLHGHTTSNPICTPARSSILTGLYSRTHGADSVGKRLPASRQCLTHLLGQAGYRCGLMGKAHFEAELSGYVERLDAQQMYYGFHEHHITEDNQIGEYLRWIKEKHPQYYAAIREFTNEGSRDTPLPTPKPGHEAAVFASAAPEEITQTAWITDRTMDFIAGAQSRSQPFFAWCSYVGPHHPWVVPEPYFSLHDPASLPKPLEPTAADAELLHNGYCGGGHLSDQGIAQMMAAYYGAISHIDHHIGRLLAWMKERGVLERTIVIFTSDHGDYNGDRRLIRKGRRMYENLLRVPLLVRMPDAAGAGRATGALSQHEDLAPTILDLLGITVPPAMQGQTLAPLLRGQGGLERKLSYFEYHTGDPQRQHVGVRDERFKLMYYGNARRWELYDLQSDPNETVNLSSHPQSQDTVDHLRQGLFEWLVRTPYLELPGEYGW